MGFIVFNNDICFVNNPTIFPNNAWIVYEDGTDTFASAQSWSTQLGCTSDDWLITPPIDLTSATGTIELNWRDNLLKERACRVSQKVTKSCYRQLELMHLRTSRPLVFSIAQEVKNTYAQTDPLTYQVLSGQTIYLLSHDII